MIMQKLFKKFEDRGIQYVHFKSNCNLDDSFLKNGDFDVLINPHHLSMAIQIITELGGKQFNSFYFGRYPGVDNWLLFDNTNGAIKHLHLHCQLASGKSLVKEYVIPWRDIILQTRVRDEKWNIYITDPNIEILLLLVRSVIKSKISDSIKSKLGHYSMHKDLKAEWDILSEQINVEKVKSYIDVLFSEKHKEIIYSAVKKKEINSKDFRKVSKVVRKELSKFRRMNGVNSSLKSYIQEKKRKLQIIMNWHSNSCYLIQKTGMSGGLIIAFVGVDGSGKSTTTNEIHKWLIKKIECKRFYMGAGDGNKPLYARIIDVILCSHSKNAKKEFKKKSSKDNLELNNSKDKLVPITKIQYLKRRLWASKVFSIEKKNLKKLILMNKYRLNGGICLLDRYPQIECPGRNDGSKIETVYSGFQETNAILKLKEREMKLLSVVREIKPDVVFRLNITVEESMKRKPEQTSPVEFQKKIDDLKQISFQNAPIIDIDATLPYEEELIKIKEEIWKLL